MKGNQVEGSAEQDLLAPVLIFNDVENDQPKEARVRGRKPKAKAATKTERQELLRQRILSLKDDLEAAGFGALLKVPGPVALLADPIKDPKTKGSIAHVEEELGTYIQRVRITENFYQR